jgi:hypothetical protein
VLSLGESTILRARPLTTPSRAPEDANKDQHIDDKTVVDQAWHIEKGRVLLVKSTASRTGTSVCLAEAR